MFCFLDLGVFLVDSETVFVDSEAFLVDSDSFLVDSDAPSKDSDAVLACSVEVFTRRRKRTALQDLDVHRHCFDRLARRRGLKE